MIKFNPVAGFADTLWEVMSVNRPDFRGDWFG